MAAKLPINEFGMSVYTYCLTLNVQIKQVAEAAGVKYDTLIKAMYGRRPGTAAVAQVSLYIAQKGGDVNNA